MAYDHDNIKINIKIGGVFIETFITFFSYIKLNLSKFFLIVDAHPFTSYIVLPLFILLTFKVYNKPIKKNLNIWENYKTYLSNNKSLSLVLFSLIIIIGMIGAGIVNLISTNPEYLKKFSIAGFTSLIVLILGIWLITPVLNFRYKYSFLDNYESWNAEFIYRLYNNAKNLRTSTKGIVSMQLFAFEGITLSNSFIFNYKELWYSKHSKSKVSKFTPTKIYVPIEFSDIIYKYNESNNLDINKLNMYTPSFFGSIVPRINFQWINLWLLKLEINKKKKQGSAIGKLTFKKPDIPFIYRKTKVNPVYLIALNDFIRKDFTKKHRDIYTSDEELDNAYIELIKDWNIKLPAQRNYKSPHYMTFFSLIERPYEIIYEQEKTEVDFTPFIYEDKYLGTSTRKLKNKKNRKYYNLLIQTNSPQEGQKQYILLLVADKRFLPDKASASEIFNVML